MDLEQSTHAFPAPADRWLAEILGQDLLGEPRSTCHRCAMAPADGVPPTTAYAFDARIKCCAYLPELPNYLVGSALLAGGEAARSVRARIQARQAVSPLGIARPPGYDQVYDAAVNVQGRSLRLRCPHFLEGVEKTCGIHAHRNHLCSTWFCKHDRGEAGFVLWRAVQDLLQEVEIHLARHCALEEGVPAQTLLRSMGSPGTKAQQTLDGPAMDGLVPQARLEETWGPWLGREEELYEATARRALSMSWESVQQACGPEVRIRAASLQQQWMASQVRMLPERLQVGSYQLLAMGAASSLLITYSSLDPVELPVLLGSVLHYFDGRPTAETLLAIEEERGLCFDVDLLLRLVDWGVLRAV